MPSSGPVDRPDVPTSDSAATAAFFPALVKELAAACGAGYVFVAECTDDTHSRVQTLAFWSVDRLAENIAFDLNGTPCEAVIRGNVTCHPRDLQTRYPGDTGLADVAAQSYLGVPLIGRSGEVLGHIAVLDTKPMEQNDARVRLLRTIAPRAASELERVRTATQIATLNQRLVQAAERARSLLAINNAVVLNLTRDALFRAITDALHPVMPFDRSTIFLIDESRNVLRLAVAEGAIPSERFVPGLELPLEGSHAGWAFRNQRVFFRPDLAKEREFEGEEVLLREGFRSFVVVPLVVRGKSIGTLNLGSLKPLQYGAAEADLLGEVANQVALAIENMRKYEEIGRLTRVQQEVKIAADIQQALLPAGHYSGVGFEAAAASVPCRTIGGDFFDYFEVPNGSFGLALGDVAGKGPPAALLTAVLQGILAGHVHLDMGPAETMAYVNRVLVRRTIEARFATVLYATLAPDGRLTYCNAGHIPPLLVRGGSVRCLERGGLVVGAFQDAAYEEEAIQLDPADLLVVVSDGVTEAQNIDGDEFGNERLGSLVQANADLTPAALVECLLESVRQFSAGAEQHDDVTVLALRYEGR